MTEHFAPVEVKFLAGDGDGVFAGYAATFDAVADRTGDVIAPGAFAATLMEHKAAAGLPPLLWQHDSNSPVGAILDLHEDARGLAIKGRILAETARGPEAYALAKAGGLSLSIGFRTRLADRTSGGRILKNVELVEVSLVSTPANPRARITQIKSAPAEPEAAGRAAGSTNEAIMDVEQKDAPVADVGVEAKRFDQVEASIKALTERLDRVEVRSNRPAVASKAAGIDAEYKALGAFARTGDETELKAMSIGSDPDGGYLVHPELSASMTRRIFDATPMRRLCRVETITMGDAWEEPVDNGDVGATWVSESQARPATTTPTLGMLRVQVEEIYALQPVTQRLLDDAGFNVGAWLEGKIADKFARSEGLAFVSGSGVKQPRGFADYPIVSTADATRAWGSIQYVAGTDASAVKADGLKKIVWALRAPYRNGSSWLMNSNTASAVDQMKDSQGQYLWRTGMTAGAPSSLLGYPVEIDENMPDVTGNAYPIAFGNWRLAYVIVDKAGVRFLRDPFSDKPNVGFYAYRRVGGGLANSEAIKLLKIASS